MLSLFQNTSKNLQTLICRILNYIGMATNKLGESKKNKLLVVFIMLVSISSYCYFIFPIYVHLFYKCIIGTIFMIGIIIFSINGNVAPVKINPMIGTLWLLCGGLQLGCGFIVSIEYLPMACIWIFVFPVIFLIWNNRRDYCTLLTGIYKGFLYPNIIFCIGSILVVPIGNEAYTGFTTNPNALGLQIATVLPFVVWKSLFEQKKKQKLFNTIWLCLLASFVFFSRSRTITLAFCVTFFVAIAAKSILEKNTKDLFKYLLCVNL